MREEEKKQEKKKSGRKWSAGKYKKRTNVEEKEVCITVW
jgi:hypothetical protein